MKQSKTLLKSGKTSQSRISGSDAGSLADSKYSSSHPKQPLQSHHQATKATVDLKKLNLQKNPTESQSSLELLILLIHRSFHMNLEEILGLFTNQNKYLAHIIVKGLNGKFEAIQSFYEDLNEHVELIKEFYDQDKEDTYSCLYAVKPGFISKNSEVARATINLFGHFDHIYEWFIGAESKCSNTLLLGFRRHNGLNQQYMDLLAVIIKGSEEDYFTKHFIQSFASHVEFLEIAAEMLKYIVSVKTSAVGADQNNQEVDDGDDTRQNEKSKSMEASREKSLSEVLLETNVFEKWMEIAEQTYSGCGLEEKLIVLQFLGEMMFYLPDGVERNQIIFHEIGLGWTEYPLYEFVPLFNQILITLEMLADGRSTMARKLYDIVIDIFNEVYDLEDKRDFVVNGFMSLLGQFPSIPSDLFIQKYHIGKLNSSDFVLICEAIDISEDGKTLIRIGEVLKELFFHDVIANYYLGNLLPEAIKKMVSIQSKECLEFILSTIKMVLGQYVAFIMKGKGLPKASETKSDTYFGSKRSLKKQTKVEIDESAMTVKMTQITMDLAEHIFDAILSQNVSSNHIEILKNYLLVTSHEIKRKNFGTGSKPIMNILYKKFNLSKEEEQDFEAETKQKTHSINISLAESALTGGKKSRVNSSILSLSRAQVPEILTKQFENIVEKRKREEENRKYEEFRKKKEQENKKLLYKKELEKMSLIRGGFGQGEAQLKEEGFWSRFLKEKEELQVIHHSLIEDAHLESFNLIMKAHQKLLKYLFFNYSSSMYSTKATANFDDNLLRKETLSAVETIKMLKDYKLIQITNLNEIQNLIRDINVKILNKKDTVSEMDFEGFEEFIRQFCMVVWNKCETAAGDFNHLNLSELFVGLLKYLKNAFKKRGESLSFFDQSNENTTDQEESEQLRELNEILETNPQHILPEGYKKFVDKKVNFIGQVSSAFEMPEAYVACVEIFDEVIFERLGFHILEAVSEKTTKTTARPVHQISVKEKDPKKIKARAFSTMIDRKGSVSSNQYNIVSKNDLSKNIKKALLSIRNEDKIIGEQAAFALEEALVKFSPEVNSIKSQRGKSSFRIGDLSRSKALSHKKVSELEPISKTERSSAKAPKDFDKIKRQIMQRRQQKEEEERKRIESQELKIKRKKQLQVKYYEQQKAKLLEKRKKDQQGMQERKAEELKRKMQKKQKKENFQKFNQKHVDELSKEFEITIQRKRKDEQENENKQSQKEQKFKRLRAKIQEQDKKINEIRKETTEKIVEMYHNDEFQSLIEQYEPSLKGVFNFLIKNSYHPLAERQCKSGEIDFDSWLYFNHSFEISPLIVNSKDVINIFKAVTKEKQVSKDYLMGINYEEFLQSLLREAIKQKTVFGKLTQRIKDQSPEKSGSKLNPGNEFQEEEEVNVKKLLKQEDIRDDIFDHYGDLERFDVNCFKGLVYYLNMPTHKKGQDARYRQLLEQHSKNQEINNVNNHQKLRQKLKADYFLDTGKKLSDSGLNKSEKVAEEAPKTKKNSNIKDSKSKK